MLANGGIITIDDLRNYRTHVMETLYADLGKYRICGPPPPSSWAITQAIPRIVARLYRDKKMFNDAEFYHTLIEAEKLAYGQRGQLGDYLFSPESMQIARNLTENSFIKYLSKRLKDKSQDVSYYVTSGPAIMDSGTSQISVVDDDGNAVSLTSTINTAFGSKMLSKYGFIYNNQMDDFSTPGFQNHWGFEPTAANYIQPGRRPMSSMSPTIVFDVSSGNVKMVTGGTGGSKIISAVAQTLIRGLLMGQSAAEIVEMPRVHNQLTPYETEVENDFSEKILEQLERDHDQKMKKTDESLAIVYLPQVCWGTWHGQVKGSAPIEMIDGQRAPGRPYGVIDIPNPGWTEAAHKNGARSIGGWFWPRPVDFDAFLVQAGDGSFPVADKMIEIRQYFGFDGLFINQEGSVSAAQIAKFQDFLRYLKRTDPDFYLQGYDSADFDSGEVSYENRLSENNLRWLGTPDAPIYDSLFMNYWWQATTGGADRDLSKSAASAVAAGRDPRVVGFAGVEHQKGGFRPEEDFGSVAGPGRPAPTSVALFVDSQIWLNGSWDGITSTADGRATYRDLEQRFWSGPTGNPVTSGRLEPRTPPYRTDTLNYRQWDGIAHWITERSPYGGLPIATDFNVGVGSAFFLEGTKVRDGGWDNMGCADRALTWHFWTEGDVVVTLDESVSYGSGHSLALRGGGVIHLFKTDLTADKAIAVEIRAQGLQTIELGVTWQDAPSEIDWQPLATSDPAGWQGWTGGVNARGRRIARISLRTSGDGRIGRVSLREAGKPLKPAAPTGFQVADAGDAGDGKRHLSFAWDLQSDAVGYDVLQIGGSGTIWLGRVHRDVFFAEAVDLAGGQQFQLVAFGGDLHRSAPAKAVLTV